METEVSVAYSTVHQTLSFDDNVSTFSFKKSVTVNVRACLIIKGSASATSMATATLLTIRSLMMLVVYVLNEFKADIYNLPPMAKEGTTLSPQALGSGPTFGKAVLMTVAQRPNVSQRGREKLARLGSLDLATEFSMWKESK